MRDSSAEQSLRRVLLISAIDGWCIALFAGFCTVISLLFGEWIGAAVGAAITLSGIIELRGRTRLGRGEMSGLDWLIRAQVLILATVGLYALSNLLTFNKEALLAQIMPELRNAITQLGLSMSDLELMLKPLYFSLYLTVIAVTVLFQGGLALFYVSQRTKISQALTQRPPPLPTDSGLQNQP